MEEAAQSATTKCRRRLRRRPGTKVNTLGRGMSSGAIPLPAAVDTLGGSDENRIKNQVWHRYRYPSNANRFS